MGSQSALNPSMNSGQAVELSLIAPTYNEKENIVPLVERVHKALSQYKYELIIVDDNSPDGTAQLANSLSSKYPLKVIVRTTERGLASAVVAGFSQAGGQVLGVIDADLQHPPEAIPALLDAIRGGADVAIGSRYVEGGGIEGWSTKREIISIGAKTIARLLLSSVKGIKDPLAGFFLFRREVIEDAVLAPTGYKILLEVLVKGNASQVVEVPYIFKERERGKSNLTFNEQLNFLKHLSHLAWFEGKIKRFIKFCIVGASGFCVNLGLLAIFVEVVGMHKVWAQIPSYQISILTNFMFNDFWTFSDRRTPGLKSFLIRAVKFNMVSQVGWGINISVYYVALNVAGIYYIVSQIIAIAVAMMWNFFSNLIWTWRQKQGEALA
ncbi:MAG: glycosyltransferase family 2 protein, partial [Dehalococcoidia bacterium]